MFSKVVPLLRLWLMRWRTRRDIAHLDCRSIRDLGRDLGVSPSQMDFEAQKPFWRA